MYASSGHCVVLAIDRALWHRIAYMVRSYVPDGGINVDWQRDLRGLVMACDMQEITDRLDQIITLLQQDIAQPEPLDDDMLQALLQLLAAVGSP